MRGRQRELALLLARLESAYGGNGDGLLIVGAAGVGKSELLKTAIVEIGARWTVVRVRGSEQERTLVWAGLSQVVHGLRRELAGLSVGQRHTLELIFDPGAGTPDRFAISTAVHALVTAAAERAPVILAIDDLHWLDPDSAQALEFIARRLDGVAVLVLATSRPVGEVAFAERLDLAPLDRAASIELLVDLGVVPTVAAQIARSALGNPLALVQIERALTDAQRHGAEPLPSPFPASAEDLTGTLARTVATLPAETRMALHLLAAADGLGRGWSGILGSAGVALGSLAPAESAGLVVVEADCVQFVHPLFRSVCDADAPAPQRRELHRLLATHETDPARRVWHLFRGVVGSDDDIGGQLARLAEEATRSGAFSAAFEAWHCAAEVSSTTATARTYKIAAAEAALRAGNMGPAQQLFAVGSPYDSDEPGVVQLGALAEVVSGDLRAAFELLVRCADLVEVEFPERAADLLIQAARLRLRTMQLFAAEPALERLRRLLPSLDDPILHAKTEVLCGVGSGASFEFDEAWLAAFRTLVPLRGPLHGDLAFIADTIALPLAYQRRFDEALALVERLRQAAVEQNQPSLIPLLDTAKACALSRFDLPGALIAATNAIDWAVLIGQPNLAHAAFGYLANVQAALGDPAVFETVERLDSVVTEESWIMQSMAKAFYWLTMGHPDRVVEQLLPLHDWLDGTFKTVLFWQGDLGEAAVRTGNLSLAREVTDQICAFNEAIPNHWLNGAHCRLEGLLADIDSCGKWFGESVAAFELGDMPLAEARSELLWGERLRRSRRRAEARVHLTRARKLFLQIGAGRWIERCEQELIAAGGASKPVDHERDAERVLTAQELQIARLAVDGHSYKSIASMMFISSRTVETHLSAIYRKLGVKNRAGLSAAARDDPALQFADRDT